MRTRQGGPESVLTHLYRCMGKAQDVPEVILDGGN